MNLDGVISGGEQVVRGATILRLSPDPNAYCAEWSTGHHGSRGEKRWHGVGSIKLVTETTQQHLEAYHRSDVPARSIRFDGDRRPGGTLGGGCPILHGSL